MSEEEYEKFMNAQCPINGIKFVEKEIFEDGYEYIDFTDTIKIGYSKT